jgi:hypothetical protein
MLFGEILPVFIGFFPFSFLEEGEIWVLSSYFHNYRLGGANPDAARAITTQTNKMTNPLNNVSKEKPVTTIQAAKIKHPAANPVIIPA